ncbi:hypothetical protein CHS0354_024831 [Potamilus streckersoni]|uniref:Uncharacterized protein n=1 Tax=Potamilus streckersoni TaxID=2493646 RepID=A0AAE0W5L7_9BIVA|nr:hypothetical protein CHS0354_024831 [Potamilus streckersoni]
MELAKTWREFNKVLGNLDERILEANKFIPLAEVDEKNIDSSTGSPKDLNESGVNSITSTPITSMTPIPAKGIRKGHWDFCTYHPQEVTA